MHLLGLTYIAGRLLILAPDEDAFWIFQTAVCQPWYVPAFRGICIRLSEYVTIPGSLLYLRNHYQSNTLTEYGSSSFTKVMRYCTSTGSFAQASIIFQASHFCFALVSLLFIAVATT